MQNISSTYQPHEVCFNSLTKKSLMNELNLNFYAEGTGNGHPHYLEDCVVCQVTLVGINSP